MTDLYASPPPEPHLEDCVFYHTMDVPGVGTVPGNYDLRPNLDEYLGPVTFDGRRVLEIGPASGFLTFAMEQRGAEVVAIELSEDIPWDWVPYDPAMIELWMTEQRPFMDKLRRGFWFAHRHFGSRAKVHYGSAYRLPEELGRFDVSVCAAVLLHNRDPLSILHNCARITDGTMLVVEQYDPHLEETGMAGLKFCPTRDNRMVHTWWHLSSHLVREYLAIQGFEEVHFATHEDAFSSVPGGPVDPHVHYTMVLERVRPG